MLQSSKDSFLENLLQNLKRSNAKLTKLRANAMFICNLSYFHDLQYNLLRMQHFINI